MNESRFRDLNLSTDEITRLERAFCDQTFKNLFGEYLHEIQDPENQKIFEKEIIELERQQGNEIKFLKPSPNYLLKTSVQGNTKAYINISSSIDVSKLTYETTEQSFTSDVKVSIPYALLPVQKVLCKQNESCFIYTVVFHSDTLKDAGFNAELKRVMEETAFSAIEKTFNVVLDRVNYKKSKKNFKGSLQMTIIRKNNVVDEKQGMFACSEMKQYTLSANCYHGYVEPVYKIKYRNEVDLQNSTNDRYCKLDILIPKEILIEIQLPLLKSINQMKLEVKSTNVILLSENAKYRLNLALPYEICEESGNAKFDSDSHVLTLVLPVKKVTKKKSERVNNVKQLITEIDENENLEVSRNNKSNSSSSKEKDQLFENDVISDAKNTFLNPNIKYKFPSYFCNFFQNQLAFTINVKNVDKNSFYFNIFEDRTGFCIKFSSLGSGHFPMYYAMCFTFLDDVIKVNSVLNFSFDDEHLFIYLQLKEGAIPFEYFVGINKQDMHKVYLNEPEAVQLELKDKRPEMLNMDVQVSEFNSERVVINLKVLENISKKSNEPLNIASLVDKSASSDDDSIPVPKYTQNDRKHNLPEKEELCMDLHKLQKESFSNFCKKFKTQFVLDEEMHSESEFLHYSNNSWENLEINSDTENRSWIIETKCTKKAKKNRKLREKRFTEGNKSSEGHLSTQSKQSIKNIEHIDNEDCNAVSEPIDIRSAYKYSDTSARSILKKNRSYSESSGDELYHVECSRSYSVDDINFSSDSYSQSGPKKTVTFNDVISKKLYSSNISILEQRRRSKRRCQRKDRRASDSENSEAENPVAGDARRDKIYDYNEVLFSETELTSLSESGGETSDDQSDNLDTQHIVKTKNVPCSKKSHKRRGKKSARKNASVDKHRYHVDN